MTDSINVRARWEGNDLKVGSLDIAHITGSDENYHLQIKGESETEYHPVIVAFFGPYADIDEAKFAASVMMGEIREFLIAFRLNGVLVGTTEQKPEGYRVHVYAHDGSVIDAMDVFHHDDIKPFILSALRRRYKLEGGGE